MTDKTDGRGNAKSPIPGPRAPAGDNNANIRIRIGYSNSVFCIRHSPSSVRYGKQKAVIYCEITFDICIVSGLGLGRLHD